MLLYKSSLPRILLKPTKYQCSNLILDSWISTMNVFESGFSEHSIPWVCPPISLHQALPINSSPTCRVDVIWSEFIASRSPFKRTDDQRRGGGEQSETTGYPSLSHLLNPSTVASHPVGQLLTSILDMYCRPSAIPEQVAVLFKMYRLLRVSILILPLNRSSLTQRYYVVANGANG